MLKHDDVQAALSARIDGEKYHLTDDVIDAHVANCPECAQYRDKALALSRSLSFVEPGSDGMAPPKDLSEVILAGVEPEWRRAAQARQTTVAVGRVLLAILGVVFAVWAGALVVHASGMVPVLGNGDILDPAADPERASLLIEGAALRLGLASGLFFAAWKPSIISGLLPVACTMLAFMFGFTVRDFALGHLMASQATILLGLLVTTVVLLFTWAADHGYMLRKAWNDLGVNPS